MTFEWCPKCGAMLPPGLKECPRCKKKLEDPDKFSSRDIISMTIYILGLLLIPLIVIVAIGLVCVLASR